jgi:hypothetical protein
VFGECRSWDPVVIVDSVSGEPCAAGAVAVARERAFVDTLDRR